MIWTDVVDYEGSYMVSSCGAVKSLDRVVLGKNNKRQKIKGQLLKPGTNRSGYKYVILTSSEGRKGCTIHRLVARAFLKEKKEGDIVNHLNGIKTDNRVKNLEWCTRSENVIHARDSGLIKTKVTKINAFFIRAAHKLEKDKYVKDRVITYKALGKIFKLKKSTIGDIINNRKWKK